MYMYPSIILQQGIIGFELQPTIHVHWLPNPKLLTPGW